MADKSPRRPQTPKRGGPNTIRRDEDVDEIFSKFIDKEVMDSLRAEDQSKGKSAKRDKSPKRPPTPKREKHGPHGIQVDKKVEKVVKKIHDREYRGVLLPQDLPTKEAKPDKSPVSKRPPTPKREQAARNVVILDEHTEEVVRKHLEANDPFYSPPPRRRPLSAEVSEAKPKKGQVSPKSPHPQPGPMFPAEEVKETQETKETKKDKRYSVPEALLTAGQVASTIAFPASSTAEPRVLEDPPKQGFRRLWRSLRKSKPKKEKEPESEVSTTDTSVHTSLLSTSLPSDMFPEKHSSETWTQSTTTPERDMTPARLAKLSEKGENLSDSFPSEVEEGAVGGVAEGPHPDATKKQERYGPRKVTKDLSSILFQEAHLHAYDPVVEEQLDPGLVRGVIRPVGLEVETLSPIEDSGSNLPRSMHRYTLYCETLGKDQVCFVEGTPPPNTTFRDTASPDDDNDPESADDDDIFLEYDLPPRYRYSRFCKGFVPKSAEGKDDSGKSDEAPSSSSGFSILRMFNELRDRDWRDLVGPDGETFRWAYEEKQYKRVPSQREQVQMGGTVGPKMDAGGSVEKGLLRTPDGFFEVDYVKKTNVEIVVTKAVPLYIREMEKSPGEKETKRHLAPREEFPKLKPSGKPQTHASRIEYDVSSSSDPEDTSDYYSHPARRLGKSYSSRQTQVLEKSPGGTKRHLAPREELQKPKPSYQPQTNAYAREYDVSSSSDSEYESEYPARRFRKSNSQSPAAGRSPGVRSWVERSHPRYSSPSDASSDTDSEID